MRWRAQARVRLHDSCRMEKIPGTIAISSRAGSRVSYCPRRSAWNDTLHVLVCPICNSGPLGYP